ncbi:MAG: 2-isopropylmalate synthase [Bacillota bacterium]
MARFIRIFDTTLRDGEQSAGINLNTREKLEIAQQLAKLNVDIIEAGFPIASPGDFEAVKAIGENVKGPVIAGLSRALEKDIDTAYQALKNAEKPCIHTFIATSPIHMKYKLKKEAPQVLEMAVAAVKKAKSYFKEVEFSAEDATRSEWEFLSKVFAGVIKAGATVINVPDTVGYTTPSEFYKLIQYLKENTPGIDKVVLSVHCHNDLGMAVANSLAAVEAGANQVECTINGLGERAGNAALEEVVMAVKTRSGHYQADTGIATEQIYRTSRMVSMLTGMMVQSNKAIVGENAFAHEAGIHQDGILKERTTYEIMTPQSIGLSQARFVLGKHSGRHAFRERLKALGFLLSDEQLEQAYQKFLEVADKKKEVTDKDLESLAGSGEYMVVNFFELEYFYVASGNSTLPTATIRLKRSGEVIQEAACGDGPVDALYKAIDRGTGVPMKLVDYGIKAVTAGQDALGEVTVKVQAGDQVILGRGTSTDVIEASALAYLNAINRYMAVKGNSPSLVKRG